MRHVRARCSPDLLFPQNSFKESDLPRQYTSPSLAGSASCPSSPQLLFTGEPGLSSPARLCCWRATCSQLISPLSPAHFLSHLVCWTVCAASLW